MNRKSKSHEQEMQDEANAAYEEWLHDQIVDVPYEPTDHHDGTPVRTLRAWHPQDTGPELKRGQQFTTRSLMPGFTITYQVTQVKPAGITIQCVGCVADPTREAYKVEVMDPITKQWLKVAECATREAGNAYLKATGRAGLVSENR